MNSYEEQQIILEQYRIYSDAKEKFIDRQFATNRFFLVFNLVILLLIFTINILTPQLVPVIGLCVIGFSTTVMWWLNIDSYQTLIKIKYAKVLEYLETKLPEQPYHKEFLDYIQLKRKKKLIIFGDFQKVLTLIITCVYIVICIQSAANIIKYQFS